VENTRLEPSGENLVMKPSASPPPNVPWIAETNGKFIEDVRPTTTA
jgi:hypothetical protein